MHVCTHVRTYIRTCLHCMYVPMHNGMFDCFMALTGLIVIKHCVYWAGVPSGPRKLELYSGLCDVPLFLHLYEMQLQCVVSTGYAGTVGYSYDFVI